MQTNTARSKKFLENQGWSVGIVEQNVTVPAKFPGGENMIFKRDAFNFGDLLIFSPQQACIALVQTTTTQNQSSRVQKILAIPEAEGWLRAGGKIFVHGWKKSKKNNRWAVTIQTIELDKEFGGLKSRELTLEDSPLFAA